LDQVSATAGGTDPVQARACKARLKRPKYNSAKIIEIFP
jgi:hypothetical protein